MTENGYDACTGKREEIDYRTEDGRGKEGKGKEREISYELIFFDTAKVPYFSNKT